MKNHGWGSKIKLFRVFGTTFQADFAWIVVLVLMSLPLTSQFSKEYPHWSMIHSGLVGVTTCILFFTSIVVHELAHSAMATAVRLRIRSTTLFLFGGISEVGREIPNPGMEFLISSAGPVSSIALSSVFGLVWLVSRNHLESLAAISEWLMMINLLLALFNAIPSFPLDGGRILRALLWQALGNFSKATRIASIVGKAFTSVLYLVAVILFISGEGVYAISILLVGWFLWLASGQATRQLHFRELLQGLTVSDVMVRVYPRIEIGSTLEAAEAHADSDRNSSFWVILENGSLRGLLSKEQVSSVSKEKWRTTFVSEVMTTIQRLRSVHPDEAVLDALEAMDREEIHYSPVLRDGWLQGILARREVVEALKRRFRATA